MYARSSIKSNVDHDVLGYFGIYTTSTVEVVFILDEAFSSIGFLFELDNLLVEEANRRVGLSELHGNIKITYIE